MCEIRGIEIGKNYARVVIAMYIDGMSKVAKKAMVIVMQQKR